MTIAGVVVKLNDKTLFVGSGACLVLLALLAASRKEVWSLGAEHPVAEPSPRASAQNEVVGLQPAAAISK
jgi:hypothetical protein